ncbi:hypothetical protein Bca101_027798 [Brassica carinata]
MSLAHVLQKKYALQHCLFVGFPCINVAKPKHPTYIPIKHCELGLKNSNYNADLGLQESGVSIGTNFTQVEGRILQAPKVTLPPLLYLWAVVNFSSRCDINRLIPDLILCGNMKDINVEPPYEFVFQENPQFRNAPAHIRVEKMFEQIQSKLAGKPKFLLCILAERKNSHVYGPWKKKNLSELGIVTQCIAPTTRINDQYLTNVLLKINAKVISKTVLVQGSQALGTSGAGTLRCGEVSRT